MRTSPTKSGRPQRGRNETRADGLRALRVWVPDTRPSGFDDECRRQAQVVKESESSDDRAEGEAWSRISDETG